MSETAFPSLTQAELITKSLGWDVGINIGLQVAEGYVAFLRLPFIKQIFEGTVRTVGDFIFKYVRLGIDVTAIKFVNAAHESAYTKSEITLKVLAHDKGINSNEFKNARLQATLVMSQFTRFGAIQ